MDFKLDEEKKVGRTAKKKEVKPSKMRKPVVYYCVKGLLPFSIFEYERDEFGKVVTDENGNKKILMVADADGNNKHPARIKFEFTRLPIIDKKSGKVDATKNYGQFVVQPDMERYDDIIAAIEVIRKNPLNGIKNTEEFGMFENEAEYRQRVENNRLQDENKDLKSENEALKEKLRKQGVDVD